VIVETTHGRIEGVQQPTHQRFRGIPFARPPVAALRFRAPAPLEPWSGVRDASEYGLSAPQNPSLLPGMEPGPQGEDCLYLNVYTPAADSARRPVLVWIHGGGFTGGSGSQALYDAGRLAAQGDVVVVTVNYRLGALGYLYADGLDANPGQLDQIAALEWVRDNAETFGGDPGNVTIFGESAGGMAVATLLAMPAARGLFQRAIPQSGAAHHTHSPTSASGVADALFDELGVRDPARLRELPIEQLLAAQAKTLLRRARESSGLAFAPVVDGGSLPEHPLAAVRAGAARDIALMTGTTRDECKLFRMGDPRARRELDEAGLHKRVGALLRGHRKSEHAGHVIETYRKAREGRAPVEPHDLYDAIDTDQMFRVPAIRLLEAQRPWQPQSFAYLFSWESPAARGALGACHALELPFVFGTLDAPTMDRFAGSGPEAERLAERMMQAWIAFAREGDPGTADLPDWPAYDAERRATLIFDREPELAHAPWDEERAAWDDII
jgi:para-nitrobenzyl esterase